MAVFSMKGNLPVTLSTIFSKDWKTYLSYSLSFNIKCYMLSPRKGSDYLAGTLQPWPIRMHLRVLKCHVKEKALHAPNTACRLLWLPNLWLPGFPEATGPEKTGKPSFFPHIPHKALQLSLKTHNAKDVGGRGHSLFCYFQEQSQASH